MKHGILMMAHNNTSVVKTALRMLDDARFTFFLLVDAKSPFQPSDFIPELFHAKCVVLDRMTLNWAGWSCIEGEFALLRAALDAQCDYLHYLQGADLPLKTPEQIDLYFEKNRGKNLIAFQPWRDELARYKVLVKHYFVDRPNYRHNKFLKALHYAFAVVQKPFMDKRHIYHCSALYSITAEFAAYLVGRYDVIKQRYRRALAPDEVFLGNEFMASPFAESLGCEHGGRLIDWNRPEGNSPHTFALSDLEMLQAAIRQENVLFARKFQETRDMGIVRAVEALVAAHTDP